MRNGHKGQGSRGYKTRNRSEEADEEENTAEDRDHACDSHPEARSGAIDEIAESGNERATSDHGAQQEETYARPPSRERGK